MPDVTAYPLTWPHGWPRTAPSDRKYGRFSTRTKDKDRNWATQKDITLNQAVQRIQYELLRMGVDFDDVVISSDLQLRMDGLPRSGQRKPDDPGVSVWFDRDGVHQVIAIDVYTKIEQNLAAVADCIKALRALDRHGGQILNRAFTGFAALPDPSAPQGWWEVLGVSRNASRADVDTAFKRLRSQHHPDRGGDAQAFNRVQRAYEQATFPGRHRG